MNRVIRKIRKAQKENEDDGIDWVGRDGRGYGCLLVTVQDGDVGGSVEQAERERPGILWAFRCVLFPEPEQGDLHEAE